VAPIRLQIHVLVTAQRASDSHIANVSRCCDPVGVLNPLLESETLDKRVFLFDARDRNGTCSVYVLKEEATMDSARKTPDDKALSSALSDEESSVREREKRPRRPSDPSFSLAQRIESKLLAATALLSKLEPHDARARLLSIAVMRGDESLLDGILAELATPRTASRRSR